VEDEAGIELVHRTGGLVFGPKDNKVRSAAFHRIDP
jgi:hypothetical protein